MAYIGCEKCNRIIREEHGPVCVYCRPAERQPRRVEPQPEKDEEN